MKKYKIEITVDVKDDVSVAKMDNVCADIKRRVGFHIDKENTIKWSQYFVVSLRGKEYILTGVNERDVFRKANGLFDIKKGEKVDIKKDVDTKINAVLKN